MPHGFFTIEQWVRQSPKAAPQWVAVGQLNAGHTLSDAISQLENSGKPGFYRVTQTQRMVWAETENGKLKLRRWHAGSPETLSNLAEAFERDGGKWPVAKAKAERLEVKKK